MDGVVQSDHLGAEKFGFDMIERLQVPRDPSRAPLFQTSFVMYAQRSGALANARRKVGQLELEGIRLSSGEGISKINFVSSSSAICQSTCKGVCCRPASILTIEVRLIPSL